ncbi:hypothetical protein AB0F15_38835 [Amycolatopsis sp. NPDC026612]|uniref:alpha-L-rhamnosidase-related protein n=1 Tax=Amycolatopsis sp. NPDC026612 TaxID=3155466 RepID=UPI0033F0EF78
MDGRHRRRAAAERVDPAYYPGRRPRPADRRLRGPSPEWASAYTTAMWTLWDSYGDKAAVARHYPGPTKFVDYEISALDGAGPAHTSFGDWSPRASARTSAPPPPPTSIRQLPPRPR